MTMRVPNPWEPCLRRAPRSPWQPRPRRRFCRFGAFPPAQQSSSGASHGLKNAHSFPRGSEICRLPREGACGARHAACCRVPEGQARRAGSSAAGTRYLSMLPTGSGGPLPLQLVASARRTLGAFAWGRVVFAERRWRRLPGSPWLPRSHGASAQSPLCRNLRAKPAKCGSSEWGGLGWLLARKAWPAASVLLL